MPADRDSNAPRAALYGRVSSDLQSVASIEDQLRLAGLLGMLFEHYAR